MSEIPLLTIHPKERGREHQHEPQLQHVALPPLAMSSAQSDPSEVKLASPPSSPEIAALPRTDSSDDIASNFAATRPLMIMTRHDAPSSLGVPPSPRSNAYRYASSQGGRHDDVSQAHSHGNPAEVFSSKLERQQQAHQHVSMPHQIPFQGYDLKVGSEAAEHRPMLQRAGSFVQYVDEAAQGSMLITAASKNQLLAMNELLGLGVSPNSADYDRRSALHIACAEGHLEAANLLLEHGATVNVRDRFGLTPLDEAVKSRNNLLVKALVTKGAELSKIGSETSLLTLAAQNREEDIPLAKLMLESKVDPNCADYDGRTPLHLAVCESNVALAEILLNHGADPLKEDRWKCTPLMECSRHANRTGMNEMTRLFHSRLLQHEEESAWSIFTVVFAGLQAVIIILMFSTATYSEGAAGGDEALEYASMTMYPYFQDVNVMVFIGFGYLMTFLRKNIFNSLGLTFMVAAMVIEWHMLVNGFFHQAFCNYLRDSTHCGEWHKIPLGLDAMLVADFCAASILITYGALLGKVTPAQLCVMAFFEVIFYTINEYFGFMLQITDIGGTMVIHMFGAYFGLAFSIAIRNRHNSTHVNNSSVYHSDAFAMIGTIFLFMFWPSFNGAPSSNESQRERVVINTFLSISASCFCAFIASHVARREHKFNMVDVQNATLAGGVAMGTCADLVITPGAAVAIGSIAGTVSVLGYVFVQPLLERKLHFHDTCGVNNLHGMPSIIGAFAGVIAAGLASEASYGPIQLAASFPALADHSRTPGKQAAAQTAFIFVTLGFSLITGFLTGYLTKMCVFMRIKSEFLFSDEDHWEVPGLENPYYFDHRGEIERTAPNESVELAERLAVLEKKLSQMNHNNAALAPSKVTSPEHTTVKSEEIERALVQVLRELQSRSKVA